MSAQLPQLKPPQTKEMEAVIVRRPLRERRPFGAYYTPRLVAETLANWAIRSAEEIVLEPGFGGCGFLEASHSRISTLGATIPFEHIYGCDTDPAAFTILGHKLGEEKHGKHFLLGDFLSLRPMDFEVSGFNIIIGNPPYVSLHAMQPAQRLAATKAMSLGQFKLDKRASLWAYFVLHALTFLRQGGRCAWVLPSSYLHAEYANDVRHLLTTRFSRLIEITLEQRLFSSEGAKERTVVVLGEGYQTSPNGSSILRLHTKTSKELEEAIANLSSANLSSYQNFHFLPPHDKAASILEMARKKPTCRKLGEFIDIKIGIVTGANAFFIKNEFDWNQLGIAGKTIRPILSKFSQASGLELTTQDLQENKEKGVKCLLLDVGKNSKKSKKVTQYLASFPSDRMKTNSTFKKRATWYCPDDGKIPDGFISYMCDHGPRIALNPAKTTSTNTIHRIYFRDFLSETQRKAIALSMLTSVTQLSAELVGRSYGSGVLKLEPSEARQVDIVVPEILDPEVISTAFDTANNLLRQKKECEARQVADDLLIAPLLGKALIAGIDAALSQLRAIRREPRATP